MVFNYLPLLNDALSRVSQTLSGILGRQVALPTITVDTVPSQAITMIEGALGVTLPDDFGSIVLFQGDTLATIQSASATFDRGLILALIVFLVSVVLALVLSTNRRRTLIELVVALIVVVVLERRFATAESNHLVGLMKPENQAAGAAIVDAFLGSLLLIRGAVLVEGIASPLDETSSKTDHHPAYNAVMPGFSAVPASSIRLPQASMPPRGRRPQKGLLTCCGYYLS